MHPVLASVAEDAVAGRFIPDFRDICSFFILILSENTLLHLHKEGPGQVFKVLFSAYVTELNLRKTQNVTIQ